MALLSLKVTSATVLAAGSSQPGAAVKSATITVPGQILLSIGSGALPDPATARAPTGNSTTDTATVLAAMQSGLPLAAGNYVCTAAGLNLSAGTALKLQGQGSQQTFVTIPAGAFGFDGVSCSGSTVGSKYNLTVQANLGDKTLTVSSADATALAATAGDYLHLWSSKLVPATDSNGAVQGEIVRVQSVNTGTGVITLYGTIDDTYALADTARLRKLSLLNGCYVKGITFINSAPLTGGSNMIQASWTRRFRMRDVEVIAGDGPGLQITDSVDPDVEIMVRDLANDPPNNRFGYGVLAWGATRGGSITVDAERCRHAFTTGADTFSGFATNPQHCGVPRHIDVRGEARETTDVGWDTHSQGDDIRFYISAVACQGAFQARAPNVKLMSWSFQNCRDASYLFWTAKGFRAMPGESRSTLTGNAAVFRVGDTSGNILTDVKFFGLHSDADGHVAVLQNCSDVIFSEPVISSPTGAAFVNSGGISNVQIVLPITDNVATMISGGTTGITTVNTPGTAPINVAAAPYNAKGDYKIVTDAAITTGTAILTSATAGFVATVVGMSVNVQGAGAAGVALSGTILTFTNSTTVVLNTNAGTTVSGATMGFGTDNHATIVSALAAGATQVYFPTGNYYCDMSGSAFALVDGHTIIGDGWQSIITFGPEGQNASANLFAANAGTVRLERIRLVAPTTLGASGSAFGLSMSSSVVRAVLKDVNLRLFSFGVSTSVSTIIEMIGCEIEGRTTGGANCVGVNDSATGGSILLEDCYLWNIGLGNNSYVSATTGTSLDVHKCRFDTQTGTGAVISHTDASALTTSGYSRVRACWFGSGLGAVNVRTPYQGSRCEILNNDFLSNVRSINVQGSCLIQGCRFITTATLANLNLIDTTVTSSSVPSLRLTGCHFEGPAVTSEYAINFTSNAEAEIDNNVFNFGAAGNSAGGEILIGTGIGSTNRIEIRNNKFAGNTNNNYCVKAGSGLISVTNNAFTGTYAGGVVASEGGTPPALRVRGNEFNQATNTTNVVLTTVPTILDVVGNYGNASGTSSGAGYRTISASQTQTATDELVGVTSTAAARTYTLLAVGTQTKGKLIEVVDESNAAATNNITVACAGADTFLGAAASKVLNVNGGKLVFYSNGTNWILVEGPAVA